MRTLFNLLTIIFLMISSSAAKGETIRDLAAAREFCDRNPLDRVEGIWEFPEDNTVVLISCANEKRREYTLTVISSPDCRLHPGEKIGSLSSSVDSDKFRLSLFTSRHNGILSDPSDCLATLTDRDGTIRIEKRKFRISTRINRFLPKFWQLLTLFSSSSPLDKLPKGLIRIYPSPAPRNPIYI
ncbi:MAG: hypothetical protein HDS03_07820 [Bacteroides sp.]|nr:hypothetical protein [Bacteroides sp.]